MLIFFIFFLILSNAFGLNNLSILLTRNCFVFTIFCFLCALSTFYITYLEKGLGLFGSLFQTSSITHFFHLFIILIFLIISQLTSYYPRKYITDKTKYLNLEEIKDRIQIFLTNWAKRKPTNLFNIMSEQFTIMEYSLISLFVIIGGIFLISSGDLVSIFLSIELQSYGLYLITVLYRDSEKSTSSGLTYFLLGSLSSCFILLGIAFIYINTGITFLDNYYLITNLSLDREFLSLWYKTSYIQYSLILISVGFLFKISAAPFHFWSPDVYDGVPTIVTTFIAIIAKLSILTLLLQIVHYTKSNYISADSFTLNSTIILSSLLSLLIGTVLGLTQNRIKRLLAYSTISHLGFILLALTIETAESRQAFIFYINQYTVTNLNAFLIVIAIGYSYYLYINNKAEYTNLSDLNNSPLQMISQIKGYYHTNPFLSVSLVITMLSFVGLPPLIGFFAKQMILSSALDNGFIFLVFVAVITSVIGAVYYLSIIKTLIFEKAEYKEYCCFEDKPDFKDFSINIEEFKKENANNTLSTYLSLTISHITLFIFIFILAPIESLNLCNILSILTNRVSFDNAEHLDLFFQDSGTPQMEGLEELDNNIMVYLFIILFAVSWFMAPIVLIYIKNNIYNKYVNHGTLVELIWTITPALILVSIAFPSFKLLYLMDEVIDPTVVIHGEGHQWYWSYQYPDFTNVDEEYIEFDSYIIPENDLEKGSLIFVVVGKNSRTMFSF